MRGFSREHKAQYEADEAASHRFNATNTDWHKLLWPSSHEGGKWQLPFIAHKIVISLPVRPE